MKIASYLKQSERMKNLLWFEKLESTSEVWNSWRVNVKGKLLHIFFRNPECFSFPKIYKKLFCEFNNS